MNEEICFEDVPEEEVTHNGGTKDEPVGCIAHVPYCKTEELAVEGCICVAILSLATTALGMILLKDK